MSFNAKNLSYEAKEPSFLRKLREENGGGSSLRHERSLARPKKQRVANDDDDEPTYVDEESQDTISKAEYESLMGRHTSSDKVEETPDLKGTERTQPSVPGSERDDDDKTVRTKQQVAVIGAQKRKKAVKVIGDDTQDYKDTGDNPMSTGSRADKKSNKKKKVNLSFHEDPDG